MRAAGMYAWHDVVGNVHGTASSAAHTSSMFVGSHYDTVIDAGRYDGALGIVAGIAAVKALVLEIAVSSGIIETTALVENVAALKANRSNNATELLDVPRILNVQRTSADFEQHIPINLPRAIEVVAFSDEEGVRFQSTFLGSKALAGDLIVGDGALHSFQDSQGQTLLEVLRAFFVQNSDARGIFTDDDSLLLERIRQTAIKPGAAAGYVELHIEQGPVLEASGQAVGVVSSIAGQVRALVRLWGVQGHAGTVPMWLRHDTMVSASEAIVAIENMCVEATKSMPDNSLVCTVGTISVWPGAFNVVPGAVNFTLDVRSQSNEHINTLLEEIKLGIDKIAKRRGVTWSLEIRHEAAAVRCDTNITNALSQAALQASKSFRELYEEPNMAGFSYNSCKPSGGASTDGLFTCGASFGTAAAANSINNGHVPELVSGAGHDAMAMARACPIGMLFVRCRGGVSHSPEEFAAPDDIAAGTTALWQFLRNWMYDHAR